MANCYCPPKTWFDLAIDVVNAAQKKISIHDYKANAKLEPYAIGTSYQYRVDVLQELITSGVIWLNGNFLELGNTDSLEWLQSALLSGSEKAWEFADSVDYGNEKKKKFDMKHLSEIGRIGEDFIISLLQESIPQEAHGLIKHVSTIDDTLGFDIVAPSTVNIDKGSLLEVKTSVRDSSSFDFYLSRNEFEVGRKRPDWSLIAVTIRNGKPELLGHLFAHQIESRVPRDIDQNVKWQSSHFKLEKHMFRKYLP